MERCWSEAMSPRIYFSYGMTKTGSTLAFELARSALILSGKEQPRLSTDAVMDRRKLNFVSHLSDQNVAALVNETDALGHMVAIKTHTRPDPAVVRLLQEGRAMAHAVYRDPRDMALSMVDHGVRSAAKGKKNFTEFQSPYDAIENICHQTNSLLAWLSLPNVRPLYFDDVAFNTEEIVTLMMDEMGVSAPIGDVIYMATHQRFTQLNKGVKARHETEMDEDLSATFRAAFAPLYEKLINNRAALPRDGRPVLDANEPLFAWPETNS